VVRYTGAIVRDDAFQRGVQMSGGTNALRSVRHTCPITTPVLRRRRVYIHRPARPPTSISTLGRSAGPNETSATSHADKCDNLSASSFFVGNELGLGHGH